MTCAFIDANSAAGRICVDQATAAPEFPRIAVLASRLTAEAAGTEARHELDDF